MARGFVLPRVSHFLDGMDEARGNPIACDFLQLMEAPLMRWLCLRQGSNAHVVLEVDSSESLSSITDLPKQQWQQSRHWFAPSASALLQRVISPTKGTSSTVKFCGKLRQPSVAYFGDFAVCGQRIIPSGIAIQVSFETYVMLR